MNESIATSVIDGRSTATFESFIMAVATALTLSNIAIANPAGPTNAPPPNIVLILADDLAWKDLACYGHPWHETPHIDRLASQGIRFTNAYASAPICSASRASLLTGKTTARLGFEFVTKNKPGFQQLDVETPLRAPPITLNLALSETTIAETLASAGYATAFFGKWHLNTHHKRYLGWSPTHGPHKQGFQLATEDFGNHPYAWRQKPAKPLTQPGSFPKDSLVNQACDYLKQPGKKPHFAMVSHFYVHTPVKTPCAWLI
ncbi:MAG: sulfatase-like hydrolase/transferase, partial [Planctomycetota bacterium]